MYSLIVILYLDIRYHICIPNLSMQYIFHVVHVHGHRQKHKYINVVFPLSIPDMSPIFSKLAGSSCLYRVVPIFCIHASQATTRASVNIKGVELSYGWFQVRNRAFVQKSKSTFLACMVLNLLNLEAQKFTCH